MSKSTTIQLADDIVSALNAKTDWVMPFSALRLQLPSYDITELNDVKVSVIPRGRTTELATREDTSKTQRIEIGIQQHVTDVNSVECDTLGALVEEIEDYLILGSIGAWTCTSVINVLSDDSTFAKEHLVNNVYTAVLVCEYQ